MARGRGRKERHGERREQGREGGREKERERQTEDIEKAYRELTVNVTEM